MSLEYLATLPGFFPLSVSADIVLGQTVAGIASWSMTDAGPRLIVPLDRTPIATFARRSRLLSRALRIGISTAHHLGQRRFLIADRQSIRLLDADGILHVEKSFPTGMRVLRFTRVDGGIAGTKDGVYYGDYGPNRERRPLSIHHRDTNGAWNCAYTFPAGAAEHIHSIIPDRWRHCLWILTGDYGTSAAIWQARDNFSRVERVIGGTQDARACVAFPFEEGLLYATDSHLKPNSIRWLKVHADGVHSEAVRPMVGSCIYGGRIGTTLIFTTAFEPGEPTGNRLRDLLDLHAGPGILGRAVELVSGSPEQGFETQLRWDVDWWPKRLFQFSSIMIPELDSDASVLPLFAMGIRKRDGHTEVYRFQP